MKFKTLNITSDLTIVGAGMPGICAAIQAARSGLKVALINNRGYLGGNASPEIRVDVCGADGANEFNFYARESGIIEELRMENLYRNPQGNPYLWHNVLLDYIFQEKNISLFLNTNIDEVVTNDNDTINYVAGSQLGTEKHFKFISQLYVDDTGDGTVGYLAGAEYRIGRESKDEFNERIAPDKEDKVTLLSTLSFYSKDTGRKCPYKLANFVDNRPVINALKYREIPDRIPGNSRYEGYRMQWFYETGYRRDPISDAEEIMQDHRELVYSIWDYIKNSGKYRSETFDLEYVSPVPGKRESRRLIGDYILNENDIVNQTDFYDVIGYGGWSIDLHANEGFFSTDMTTRHYNLNGIYKIPLRSCYSKNIRNLFVASRCMSTTHVAFGSTRVMATLSTVGQAVGLAAALCIKYKVMPRDIAKKYIKELQQELLKNDQYILGHKNEDKNDLVRKASIKVSSYQKLTLEIMNSEEIIEKSMALILPVVESIESIELLLMAKKDTELVYNVYTGKKIQNYKPEIKLYEGAVKIKENSKFNWVKIPLNVKTNTGKIFIELMSNKDLIIGTTKDKINGVISLKKENYTKESTYVDIETHEIKTEQWMIMKDTICFKNEDKDKIYNGTNINNGYNRNYKLPNIWLSESGNKNETIYIDFNEKQTISQLYITFDSNLNQFYDNLEIYYDYNVMPELVKDYKVYAKIKDEYVLICEINNNHHRVNRLKFDSIQTAKIKIVLEKTNGANRFGIYEIRAYK